VSHTPNRVSPGGFFQRLAPGWSQWEETWGRNPVPSGLSWHGCWKCPQVLGNDPFHALRARASVCWCCVGSSPSEGRHTEVRRGLQESRKGHLLELAMLVSGEGRRQRLSPGVLSSSQSNGSQGSRTSATQRNCSPCETLSQPSSYLSLSPPETPVCSFVFFCLFVCFCFLMLSLWVGLFVVFCLFVSFFSSHTCGTWKFPG